MPGRFLIGQAAAAAGLNAKTLRYYEAIGLLPPSDRTESRYRVYSPDAVRRLGFIVKAKRLGLTLREIREILGIRDGGHAPCIHLHHLLLRKVQEVDRRIEELTSLRQELRRLARRCGREIRQGGQAAVCPHVESLPAVPSRQREPGQG
ncbi:MAG: heavy metal-responsive transcriptional regulator [candidate division NC10 bacterium]|nr:heavy metal-responsive transcriptional regulator [candidate division NC10 bacterium]MBI3085438.1 heavy metal-responsive transcriptional regulator [candidate division NC10 bacterium]